MGSEMCIRDRTKTTQDIMGNRGTVANVPAVEAGHVESPAPLNLSTRADGAVPLDLSTGERDSNVQRAATSDDRLRQNNVLEGGPSGAVLADDQMEYTETNDDKAGETSNQHDLTGLEQFFVNRSCPAGTNTNKSTQDSLFELAKCNLSLFSSLQHKDEIIRPAIQEQHLKVLTTTADIATQMSLTELVNCNISLMAALQKNEDSLSEEAQREKCLLLDKLVEAKKVYEEKLSLIHI